MEQIIWEIKASPQWAVARHHVLVEEAITSKKKQSKKTNKKQKPKTKNTRHLLKFWLTISESRIFGTGRAYHKIWSDNQQAQDDGFPFHFLMLLPKEGQWSATVSQVSQQCFS